MNAGDPQQLVLATQNLRPHELADLLGRLNSAERKQVVIDLLAGGVDRIKVLAAVRDLELQHEIKIRRRLRTIWWTLAAATGGLSAFHGYRRNRSVGWALGWFAVGTILPLPTIVIAMAQGFGKVKASAAHKQLGSVPPATAEVWTERLQREAEGLDFSDPEDRAAFRSRVAAAMKHVKTWLPRELAMDWGKSVKGNAAHETAVRACADAWIARAMKGFGAASSAKTVQLRVRIQNARQAFKGSTYNAVLETANGSVTTRGHASWAAAAIAALALADKRGFHVENRKLVERKIADEVMNKRGLSAAAKRLNKWVAEDSSERHTPMHYVPTGTDELDTTDVAIASIFPEWNGSQRMSGAPSNWVARVGAYRKRFATKTAAKDAALAELVAQGKARGRR